MIVCHCHALNDRSILDEVAAGARDADEVLDRCGAGGQCGGCAPTVDELVDRFSQLVDASAA
jgi:bacterioferritin-associated ferredoxin